jgi:protein-tyrosine phosphatase
VRRREGFVVENRIVVVCTANMIRSPFIAGLLSSRAQGGIGRSLRIESAGTAARAGAGAAPEIRELAEAHGFDLAGHRTRRLGDGVLEKGDTVLCAERAHRRVVLDLRPDLISSVFTVREFARLVAAISARGAVSDWDALVRSAARERLTTRAAYDDDVVDPVGGPPEVWTVFERQATRAVSTILDVVGALPDRPVMGVSTAEERPRGATTRREFRALLRTPSGRRAARTE